MAIFREVATEFIQTLHRRNEESQKEIDQIESLGLRFREGRWGGPWVDVTDQEIALLRQDISSRNRTITRLESELSGSAVSAAP
jgi:hypothetical protein